MMMTSSSPEPSIRNVVVALVGAGFALGCATGGGDFQVESEGDGGSAAAQRVPAGTDIRAQLEDRLSVAESEEGDQFHATVDEQVTVNGRTAIPEGALIHGEVTGVQRSDGEDRPNVLKLHFNRIDVEGRSHRLGAELTEANPKTKTGEDLKKVGAGAAAGAILGGIIGRDLQGALIGAGIGAAAGTAVALGTREHEAVLERGSEIRLRLTDALDLGDASTRRGS